MTKRNYLNMQDIVETKPVINEFIKAINKKKDNGMFKDPNIAEVELRKYIISDLIERFASWKELGDCLPTGMPISKDKIASVIIENKGG